MHLSPEKCTTLKSVHIIFQNKTSENSHIGGVAIMINRKFANNVTKCCAISERVTYTMPALKKIYSVQIIHGYASTSTAADEVIEMFHGNLIKAKQQKNS